MLSKHGFSIITGVIHKNDIDYHVGQGIGATVIGESPFEEISNGAYMQALDFLKKTDYVIDTGFPVGPLNRRNCELLLECCKQKKVVCTMRSKQDAGKLYGKISPKFSLLPADGVNFRKAACTGKGDLEV